MSHAYTNSTVINLPSKIRKKEKFEYNFIDLYTICRIMTNQVKN